MEKEFVGYDMALELKELGFDEPCLAFYEPNNKEVMVVGVPQRYNDPSLLRLKDFCAPLYQQAFRWFREKHDLDSFVNSEWRQTVKVGHYFNAGDYYSPQPSHLTYEEAELACLKKLIEIVKQKVAALGSTIEIVASSDSLLTITQNTNKKHMIQAFKFIRLIVHLSLSAIAIDFLGDFMSENNNIFLILGGGLLISLIILSIIYHVRNLVTKNQI